MAGISKRIRGSWVSSDYGIMKTDTDTITTLPAVLYPNAVTATVGLKGNMSQSGSPTPQNPITPQETGERTGNLCYLYKTGYRLDGTGNEIEAENYNIYAVSASANTTYTINADYGSAGTTTLRIIAYNNGSFSYKIAEVNLNAVPYAFTTPSNCDEVKFSLSNQSTNIMLNTGSQPIPYQPYGYKLDIKSANTITPVYLGEVETTRRVRKWVLKGDEDGWFYLSGFVYNQNITQDYLRSSATTLICSHYKAIGGVAGGSEVSNGRCALYRFSSVQRLYIRDNNYTTAEDFKTYLAQQYSAGTPVTVWYVLAEPETGIVNEPIRKIGDYADTVSGISIPTIAGANTLSVDTTVQPSEVTVNYKGWHPVLSVHERENGAWT